jgi:hypothetical protein
MGASQLFTTIITIKSRVRPPHNARRSFIPSLFFKITVTHFLPIRPPYHTIRFIATMSNNPQIRVDVVSPVTSDQHWMRNPRCISCLAQGLDIKDCPFYNVCPSCGSSPDSHGEHCPFRAREPSMNFFRLHPLEPGKTPWWKYLNLSAPSLRQWVPHDKESSPLSRILHPYPDFPPRTLPDEEVSLRTAWDNECWEYGITDPPDLPAYIRSTPSAYVSTRKAECQAVVSECQTAHSKRFKSIHKARSDERPLRSLHSHSMLKNQGFPRDSMDRSPLEQQSVPTSPRDSTNRSPLEKRSVPTSLVAPGIRSGVQGPFNSDIVRIPW